MEFSMPEFEHLELEFKFYIANIINWISNADFEVHKMKFNLFSYTISLNWQTWPVKLQGKKWLCL